MKVNDKSGNLEKSNIVLQKDELAWDEKTNTFLIGDGKTPFKPLRKIFLSKKWFSLIDNFVDSSNIEWSAIPLTNEVSADLTNTTVTAGTYSLASITVDAKGRVTSASSGKSGTAANNQVAIWTSDGVLEGDTNLQFDGTKLSVGGTDTMTVNGNLISTHVAVHGANGITEAEIEVHKHGTTAAAGAHIYGARSMGTGASPTIVQDADRLLSFTAVGYDGTDYATSSQIVMEVDGTPGANDMPGRIIFLTSSDGSQTLTERMRLKSTGNLTLQGIIDTYNGIPTANNGVLSSIGTPVHLTSQAASIAATTCYTTTADGFYQVAVTGAVTQAATTSSTISTQVRWTNQADNVVKTTTAVNNVHGSNGNTTGTGFGYVITIYAKTGTDIQYITTYASSGATSMQYSLDVTVIKL